MDASLSLEIRHIAQDIHLAMGFAVCAHRKQTRKYTGEPYHNHVLNVAKILTAYGATRDVIVAGLLHDVLEDTDVTADEMRAIFGDDVTNLVLEVTDVSRPSDGNRATRKRIDLEHLAKSSPEGATIKLADLIHNTGDIVAGDAKFAAVYLDEKAALLDVLKHGNKHLWRDAVETLREAREELASVAQAK